MVVKFSVYLNRRVFVMISENTQNHEVQPFRCTKINKVVEQQQRHIENHKQTYTEELQQSSRIGRVSRKSFWRLSQDSRLYVYFMLNSAEHEIFMLINMKMPTIADIFIFIRKEILTLSYV